MVQEYNKIFNVCEKFKQEVLKVKRENVKSLRKVDAAKDELELVMQLKNEESTLENVKIKDPAILKKLQRQRREKEREVL